MVNVSRKYKPDFIEEPNKGNCRQFLAKQQIETEVFEYVQQDRIREKRPYE